MKKLFSILVLTNLLISCGSSNESTVKKYLPGTYTRSHKEGESIGFGYFKEITIKHLKGNEYRITCTSNDSYRYSRDEEYKVIKINTSETPDTFDFEISNITLKQKSDSISKYFVEGFVTNVVSNGTTFSDADDGINNNVILNFTIGKNQVEVLLGGKSLPSIRKK